MKTGWTNVQLGQVCSFKYGQMPKKEDLVDAGYPVFSGYGIVGASTKFHYEKPQIVVVARGVGGTGDVKLSPPFCFLTNLSIAVLPEDERIHKPFLYYRLAGPGLWELRTGSAQAQITIERLRTYRIELPPFDTQIRIASILGAYDDLIEVNRRRIALLEGMARRLFDEWFVRFRFPGHQHHAIVETPDGSLPDGWAMRRIGETTAYLSRGIAPKYDETSTSLVVSQKCIRNQRLSLAPARTQSKPVPTEKLVQPGDILINSTGVGTLGRVAQAEIVPSGLTVDSHVTIVRPDPRLDRDFFGHALLRMEPVFERLGVGATGQTELNRSRVADVVFAEPPLSLQTAFGRQARPLRLLAFQLARQNDIAKASRDLLLPRLISGELTVSNAERELEAVA